MTIANLIQILVLMLLFITIHREIAIVQFKFFVFYIKSMMIIIGISYFFSAKRFHFRDIVLFYDSWCNNKIKEKLASILYSSIVFPTDFLQTLLHYDSSLYLSVSDSA